jgi:hypothetical protein
MEGRSLVDGFSGKPSFNSEILHDILVKILAEVLAKILAEIPAKKPTQISTNQPKISPLHTNFIKKSIKHKRPIDNRCVIKLNVSLVSRFMYLFLQNGLHF